MLKNDQARYGSLTKVIHWLVAACVIGLFAVGYWMVDLDYYDPWYTTAPYYHKSVGITLALIMIFRLYWRVTNISPASIETHQNWEKKAAHIVHWIFYLLIFSLIVTGYLISTADNRPIEVFGLFEVPSLGELFANQEDNAGEIHEWLAYSLIGLAAVHALAAIKHHFLDKDNTLKRMF